MIWLLIIAATAFHLTNKNFDTMTSQGKWLVLFCSPSRFEICQDLQPFWAHLELELKDVAIVAQVEASQNLDLKRRFSVGYGDEPAIFYIHDSRFYRLDHERSFTTE